MSDARWAVVQALGESSARGASWRGIDGFTFAQQHHRKLVSAELCIELSREVDGVSRIAETAFFVLGTRKLLQEVAGLEIDGFPVKIHSPDTVAGQHLLGAISGFVGYFNQYFGLGSRHHGLQKSAYYLAENGN